MSKKETPSQAVKRFCRQCCCGIRHEVVNCTGDKPIMGGLYSKCPFYEYRLGKGRVSVKTIRKHCLMCMGGSKIAVKECTSEKCPLYPFRFGTNPNYGKTDRKRKSRIAKKMRLSKMGLESKQKTLN